MREEKELMETQRERLVRGILDDLEEISYNKNSATYREKIAKLPTIKKNSKVPEAMGCFLAKDGIVQSIRVASDKMDKTSIGSISRYSGVVKDVIDALNIHARMVNEQLGQKTKTKLEGTPKNISGTAEQLKLSSIGQQSKTGTMVTQTTKSRTKSIK